MTQSIRYLLDANVFISAKRLHYGFDFCPGFWKALTEAHHLKRLHSIQPVRDELIYGKDDLSEWVKEAAATFFKGVDDNSVLATFGEVSQWVADNGQFKEAAKAKFLSGADPWLVAYAKVNDHIIVSNEVSSAASKSKIKLPDVAKQFAVVCNQPHEMLRELSVRLRLAKNTIK